jgi:hypothetical protein
MDEMELPFHLIHDTGRQQYRWTKSEAVNTVMMGEDMARNT